MLSQCLFIYPGAAQLPGNLHAQPHKVIRTHLEQFRIQLGFGIDVQFIDHMLQVTFDIGILDGNLDRFTILTGSILHGCEKDFLPAQPGIRILQIHLYFQIADFCLRYAQSRCYGEIIHRLPGTLQIFLVQLEHQHLQIGFAQLAEILMVVSVSDFRKCLCGIAL